MPIHAPTLLTDLKKWVTRFEDDLRQQCKDVPALDVRLKAQYKLAKDAGRTAFSYTVWRDGELTQAAVGWVLSCVFVRFLEDNDLLERSFLSGVGENRGVADETRAAYFRENRAASDNDYLAHVMSEVGKLPGMADLMDARHNALWNAAISPDAAKAFIEFWRRIDPATGKMAHEFTDPDFRTEPGETPGSRDPTRFLGDLYQDLSESARKKFALLQTPDFVEEFILDRTLDPAINTFGLNVVRMIDPTCGSGHFLLGGFRRLLALWEKQRPDLSDKERAVKALDGVFGVDINPFAVAIARFRLLLAAWRYCEVKRLRSAPDFKVNLAVGDSLLHGARFDAEGKPYTIDRESLFGGDELAFKDETAHHFEVEDAKELHRILGQQYHAVVGNPPYITVKDKALSDLYRDRYASCHREYSLSVPFMERIFDLALAGNAEERKLAGFTGQITANSFMKREFGKKLIESYLPNWDVTHVIDTSGAYIPGHGTPTVIIFGRNQTPISEFIRTVLGIRAEPLKPSDPAYGVVWQAIIYQIDQPGSQSDWVSSCDSIRTNFHRHPWSIGGGGAAELKKKISDTPSHSLSSVTFEIGSTAITGEDEVFVIGGNETASRWKLEKSIDLVEGSSVRDWQLAECDNAIWVYDTSFLVKHLDDIPYTHKALWPTRRALEDRKRFSIPVTECGLAWYEWRELYPSKLRTSRTICWAEVATHNNFVFDRGGKVFKQTAPVIKLKADQNDGEHASLLGVLNSSTGCFWMKQSCFPKGGSGIGRGIQNEAWESRYAFNATQIGSFPITIRQPAQLPTSLVEGSTALENLSPSAVLASWISTIDGSLHTRLASAKLGWNSQRQYNIAWQEELDWQIYEAYGLSDPADQVNQLEGKAMDGIPPDGITLGQRAFEIRMARQMASGEFETTWFERHKDAGSKPITELPAHWPANYRALVERRLAFIEANKNLNLIERPEYKRRWNTEPWAKRQQAALQKWLLTRLETYFHDANRMVVEKEESKVEGPKSKVEEGDTAGPSSSFSSDLGPSTLRPSTSSAAKLAHIRPLRARFAGGSEPRLVSVRQLAQTAQADSQWMEAATVFAGRADFDVAKLVETLVLAESVPVLPAQRYKPAGLRKREEWEKTWELQRAEDEVEEEVKSRKVEGQRSEEELKKLVRKEQLARVGEIPVPPKYGSGDFLKSSYWKLRGKLDVPKERWVLYPGMEGGHDTTPVIAWAGWDHAQQAQAITGFYQQATDTWGWQPERLAPLLAALKELLPWLHQWHHAIDPAYGDRISTTYQQFYETELHSLRMTDEDVEQIRMGGGN